MAERCWTTSGTASPASCGAEKDLPSMLRQLSGVHMPDELSIAGW